MLTLGSVPSPSHDLWASERLVYRTADDENAHWAFRSDSFGVSIASPASLPKPPVRKQLREGLAALPQETLISLDVCLKPDNYSKSFITRFDKENSWKEVERPISIGILTLTIPDHRARVSEFGITILDGYRSNGYGTEATKWALDFGFRHAALHKIRLDTVAFNLHAIHVYEKLGFVLEGIDREVRWWNGRLWDLHRYGMLEREWRAKQELAVNLVSSAADSTSFQ